ncbi:MAG: 50S ribosomal protein L6 [Methanomassiliicoccales archaeon]|jgi:large subunit ribosomal protein L6|nr:50S ribosomal protein L6 [Methanomassiliicoccales archaeon]
MVVTGVVEEVVSIPGGVTIELSDGNVTVSGPKGKLTRRLAHPRVQITKSDGEIIVHCEFPRKKERALVGTFAAHIKNMVEGVLHGFEYKMKIVYSHFPIKAYVKGDKFIIENFLGERTPRKANIVGDTKIAVKGNEVILTGIDIEAVSQTAANIERATAIKGYDSRVFQDGIYIVEKARRMSQ